MKKILVFDIEANNLLIDVDTFFVGVVTNLNTNEQTVYTDISKLVKELEDADLVIGHNVIGYDLPVLKKLYPNFNYNFSFIKKVRDTLIMSKLCYYDKDSSFSHSLEAWGERLKNNKIEYDDFTELNDMMIEYCKQDVNVTVDLYKHLVAKYRKLKLSRKALMLEQQVQYYIIKQYANGWRFDIDKALELEKQLRFEQKEALEKLREVFKPLYLPKGKPKIPKKPFKRLGVYTVGEHQPIELTQFNPASGKHIVWWIELLYGKQKWELTEKGNPKADSKQLERMFSKKEWAKPLLHYLEINKLLGQLADGDNAWLKLVQRDKIHHQVDILGTNTGRATHHKPNIAQVPTPRKFKGKESRELFIPNKDEVMVGADLSGVELRCLAHYLYPYDKGEYGKVILEQDIHTYNQEKAGLPTRDNAKTFIYAFLYGAGDEKIGEIVGKGKKAGRALKEKFLKELPALAKLNKAVYRASKRGYLIGITGRRIHIRSSHSALNALLQSLGGYIAKYWLVIANKKIEELGIQAKQLGWIHDELQFSCPKQYAKQLGELLIESATEAGKILKLNIRIDAEYRIGKNWSETH